VVLRSTRVILPDGERPASIHIDAGIITRIDLDDERRRGLPRRRPPGLNASEGGRASAERDLIDFGELVISPGIVDTHVHVNEPGRTEWEGFDTATRAAAAGGVTTIVDMPLNSIPATTTVDALDAKRRAARGRCHVDVGFWGGVVPGNESHLDALVDAGVRGFKCFLVPSGVDEFPPVDESDLRRAMPMLARRGMPLLVHAESPRHLHPVRADRCVGPYSAAGVRDVRGAHTGPLLYSRYASYLASRPPEAEVVAVRMIVDLAREFGVRSHIVHVASAEAVAEIECAKADGVSITAETCPHYLTFAAEEIADGATQFKCAPPIRESRHRDALWGGVQRGVLDLIATDHSPAPPALKCSGDFMRAWGGIASLELSLSAVWTGLRTVGASAWQAGGASRQTVSRWMSERPASLAGLDTRKGRIAAGYDADLVVWDPESEFTVDASRLQQRHKLTPYAGRCLRGRVMTTYLRGERVWDAGQLVRASSGLLL